MQKDSLRQTANRYFQMDNRGSPRDKKQRHYVIHKMIDDLFTLGETPPKWQNLSLSQIQQLIQFWQKRKIKPATQLKHMTVIRQFLESMGHQGIPLNNKGLGIARRTIQKRKVIVPPDIWQQISIPIARLLLGLQIHFGLTLSEAMRIVPDIHIQNNSLWLTREITFNSLDRLIPVRTEPQQQILHELKQLTSGNSNIITSHKYNVVRLHYGDAMQSLKLPSLKAYRYLYAQQLHQQLAPQIKPYQLSLLIMEEMGLKSRTTLWSYLNE